MNSRFRGRGVACWYVADAVAILLALTWPGWLLPVVTWLVLVALFVCAGLLPVRRRV